MDKKAEYQAYCDWAFKKEGEAIGRMDGNDAGWAGWEARALLAAGASEGQTVGEVYEHQDGTFRIGVQYYGDAPPVGTKLYTHPSADVAALRERIAKYQAVCAAAYQFVGAVDGPVRFLDALSNAANGEPASVEDSLALLPAEPSERIAGMEKDAGPRHWNPVYNTDPVQRACGELPEGIEIEIQLERDSGTVYLVDNNCGERHMIDDADTFDWTVHKAIDAAIAKEKP